MFFADLHIHSKYSRATSRDADLEHMAIWALKKGVSVVGTGDFTHPAWLAEIKEKLVSAEPGLFRLRDDLQREVNNQLADSCTGSIRFMLEVEISTIYKKGDRTRKVHHLIYAPDLEQAGCLIQQLARIGNLQSDGRPILGLDSRDLLEITLQSGNDCYLIPAHIWTPWFAVLGSQSGFDAIEDCYGDLSSEIFALETGLSSDPPMNWRLSALDRYRLVSNSDAHSPPKIGREACAFETDVDYFSIRHALETGDGYLGTVEFFPEEGKYHLDGHRKCGIRFDPQQTRENKGVCPECGKALTVGVMNRVDQLADRDHGYEPSQTFPVRSFVPLPEVISEVRGVGVKSKKVQGAYENLISKVGSELYLLERAPMEQIQRAGAPLVAEAIERMRHGQVIREAGYDGEYGRIRLFEQGELKRGAAVSLLFDVEPSEDFAEHRPAEATRVSPNAVRDVLSDSVQTDDAGDCLPRQSHGHQGDVPGSQDLSITLASQPRFERATVLDDLDAEQRAAAEKTRGPLLIVAGPGTGKTRTLTHRIAHLVANHGVAPEQCLALTFSRRAASEMAERLAKLLPGSGRSVPVMTFHALGLEILREHADRLGLSAKFTVADDLQRRQLMMGIGEMSARKAARVLEQIARTKRSLGTIDPRTDADAMISAYHRELRARHLVDFEDLIVLPTKLLESTDMADTYRRRWPWVCIDEFQDIDAIQYRLTQQLAEADGNICVIGDPDQSIYGFRGSDARWFERFRQDFTDVRVVHLTRNYRSSRTIVDAALQVIGPQSIVTNRTLTALSGRTQRIEIQSCPTERAEAEFVVYTIERLIGGSSFFSIDSGRVAQDESEAVSFNDFAVLYRTDAQAEPLCEALDRSGIPFQRKSHHKLSDEPAVQAMIQFIQRSIGASQEVSAPRNSVSSLLKQAADAVWNEHPQAAEYLARLYPVAERCGDDAPMFLNQLAMGVDADLWDARADRVSLLTLHAAKGLEFSVVFLVGCEDGLLPLHWNKSADHDLAEERRLFFVGMTRACQRLYFSHALKRHWQGKIRNRDVSPFLKEIQEELLRRRQPAQRRKKTAVIDSQLELF